MQSTISRTSLTSIPKRLRLNLSTGSQNFQHTFPYTHPTMNASTSAFFDGVKGRRSIYDLNSDSPISDTRIQELVRDAMLHVPSSFNSQSTRVIILLKDQHKKYWEMAKSTLAEGMDAETAKQRLGRLDGFHAAYGSILFLENQASIRGMQERTPAYASMFPGWSEHTSGMHQFVLWTALEAEGLGCNLQHYHTPAIENKAREIWAYPEDWQMKAQLVFGGRKSKEQPPAKDKLSLNETVKVFGAARAGGL